MRADRAAEGKLSVRADRRYGRKAALGGGTGGDMEIREAVRYALEGQAILFAGSGFSFGAKNMRDLPFKTGIGLRDALAAECGIAKTEESLENVALLYKKKKSPAQLVRFLKEEFTLNSITDAHRAILSVKWKRIYTTNYDRVIEEAAKENGQVLSPVIIGDRLDDYYDKSAVCVHINGFIDRLTIRNLDTDFKLTEKSYAYETLNGKPWFEFMKQDFRSARAIVVVGFSMKSDVDIQRLLSTPEMQRKTVYVTGPGLDEVSKALLEDYGKCEPIGTDGLAKIIGEEKKDFIPPADKKYFSSFTYEYREILEPESVELNDLVSLFYEGKFLPKLLQKDGSGEYKYLLYRAKLNFIIKNLKSKKIFVVNSDLGNGKTIFCQMLRNELREKDIAVYTLNKRKVGIESEIEYISTREKRQRVVIIDDYQHYFDVLESFSYFGIGNITFVLTVRSAINHLNYRKLYHVFNDRNQIGEEDYGPIYLDTLQPEEIKDFAYLLSGNSLTCAKIIDSGLSEETYLAQICHGRMNNMLLDLFESSDIKERYARVYEKSREESQAVRKLAIFSLMKVSMNFEMDFSQMCEILDIDYVSLSKEDSEYLNEIFDFNRDEVIVKSSIAAKYFLYSVIEIDEMMDVLIEIVKRADELYIYDKTYEELLKNVVSHSHYVNFKSANREAEIIRFYESIRNTQFCVHNPFFWEQFASACLDLNEYTMTKQCLQNAFVEAKKLSHFVPFQIETIYGKYIMHHLLFDLGKKKDPGGDDVIARLKEFDAHVMKYYSHPENNVYYVFKIGAKYKQVYDLYKDHFDTKQAVVFNGLLNNMIVKMRYFINSSKDTFYINTTKKWIKDLQACRL